jgi:CBS domain containing-hemolysin-like protein
MGMISLEDILEELVGEIRDEGDESAAENNA